MTTTGSTTTALTREHKGSVIPTPGVYDIDAKHSSVEFVARHLMITKVRGRFDDVEGTITVAEVPEESSVTVKIGAASVRTGEDQRDAHLRSGDFFDVDTHPDWTFTSTAVRAGRGPVEGHGRPDHQRRDQARGPRCRVRRGQQHALGHHRPRFLGHHRDRP